MNASIACTLFLAAALHGIAAETKPEAPTSAQIAKILGVDESRVTRDLKALHPSLIGKVLWTATYRIAGAQACSLEITICPHDQIKTDITTSLGVGELQKITREDGDVVYHVPVYTGHMGTFYFTTLINHENDWDMTMKLSRGEGVDESKLPVDISKAGIKLVPLIEALLRKPKEAQQGGAGQPATRSESDSEDRKSVV